MSDIIWSACLIEQRSSKRGGTRSGTKSAIKKGLRKISHVNQGYRGCVGGADGTRTRDPRRDRPVF